MQWDAWAISDQRRSSGDVGHDSVSVADTLYTRAHTRSQNAPDTKRTSRLCLFCCLFFQRANNTWRNTAGFNQISDDNLLQVSIRLRTRTKLNKKRRTYKVQKEKGSKQKNNRRRKPREKKKKQRVETMCIRHLSSLANEGVSVFPFFRGPFFFPFFRVPPQFYPDVLLLFFLHLFLLPWPSHAATATAPLLPPRPLSPRTSPLLPVLSSISSSSFSETEDHHLCHHLSLRAGLPLPLAPLLSLRRCCLTHCHGGCLTHRHCRCLTRSRLSFSSASPAAHSWPTEHGACESTAWPGTSRRHRAFQAVGHGLGMRRYGIELRRVD